jgi:hypothetical protein
MQSAFEKQLIGLERQFWQSMQDKDAAAAKRLTNDPCILTGAQGVSRINHETFGKIMAGATWTLHGFDLQDIAVEKLSDDIAIIGYRVRETLTVDGKPVSLEAADSSTWVRKNGEWLCAMHTEAIAGDPYGRDRVKK